MIPTGNLTTCEEVEDQSRWKKQRLSEHELQLWMTAPQPSKSIQVSKERLKRMKEWMDKNPCTIISAPSNTGKTTFMHQFEVYLVLEGKQVVTLDMSLDGKWETRSSEEELFVNYFNRFSPLTWEDVLQSKRTYILLDGVEVPFGKSGGFWSILDRLFQYEHIRVLMFAENIDTKLAPRMVEICGEEWLRLSREEIRNILEYSLRHSSALNDNQLDVVHKLTAGHPNVLKVLTEDRQFKKFKTHNSFVSSMVSLNLRRSLQYLLRLQAEEDYAEEECDFLTKMLLHMTPDGVYTTNSPETMEAVASLKCRGTITECQGGVQFSAPIFQMAIAHSIFKFPGLTTELTSCDCINDFDELVVPAICQLRPEQLRRYFEAETETARRELLVDLYGIFSTVGDKFYAVTPFVGSTFGANGYSLDIHISGLANWAVDIAPSDPTKIPPHIRAFINEGVKISPIEKWALLHLTHHNAAHVSQEIEGNHWYLCCTPDCPGLYICNINSKRLKGCGTVLHWNLRQISWS